MKEHLTYIPAQCSHWGPWQRVFLQNGSCHKGVAMAYQGELRGSVRKGREDHAIQTLRLPGAYLPWWETVFHSPKFLILSTPEKTYTEALWASFTPAKMNKIISPQPACPMMDMDTGVCRVHSWQWPLPARIPCGQTKEYLFNKFRGLKIKSFKVTGNPPCHFLEKCVLLKLKLLPH